MSGYNSFTAKSIIFSILLFIAFTPVLSNTSAAEDLKEKIKKAKTLEEVFKTDKVFQLEPTKNSYVSRVNAIFISKKGDIIVNNVGSGGAQIYIFDKNGRFIKEMGRKGKGPGEYEFPQGVTQDNQGNIYVLDQSQRQISIFDKDYKFVKQIKYTSNNQHIHVNSKKEIFLYFGLPPLPPGNTKLYNCIDKLGADGRKSSGFAELPKEVASLSFYANYDCMVIDKNDNIYESNPVFPQIRKFSPDGKQLAVFGDARVRMVTETDKNGKSNEFPKFMPAFLLFNDILIQMFDDKADFYDVNGSLLNKNIPLKYGIRCTDGNSIYLVEEDPEKENPLIHKYTVK